MIQRSWISQKIADTYGSKRGLLATAKFFGQNLVTRKYNRYSRLPDRIERVVFVCKGNICRSALAEHTFRKRCATPTASVGLDTHSGKSANQRIMAYANKLGIDMRSHLTTAINDFEVSTGDLFVCMEPDHISALQALNQNIDIVLLGHFGHPKRLYIHDPYTSEDRYAERCTKYIVDSTTNLACVLSGYNTRV